MTEFEVGDIIECPTDDKERERYEVKYVIRQPDGRVFYIGKVLTGDRVGHELWGIFSTARKVEPFFEAGKTYRDHDGELFEVQHVSERYGKKIAAGWAKYPDMDDGYWISKTMFGRWTEVKD